MKVNVTVYSQYTYGYQRDNGIQMYDYDSAIRLSHLVNNTKNITKAYNGLGDCIYKTSIRETNIHKLDF